MRINGELEIDEERGVIYFHDASSGHTALRICGLPPIRSFNLPLDITIRGEVAVNTYVAKLSWRHVLVDEPKPFLTVSQAVNASCARCGMHASDCGCIGGPVEKKEEPLQPDHEYGGGK